MYNILKAYYNFFAKKLLNFAEGHSTFVSVLQFIILFYILIGLAYLANGYLMPCLQKIVKKYNLPASIGGFCIAVGNSVPELSTNMFSSLDKKPEMIGFGFGTIVGSGVFDYTLCFGLTAFLSFIIHKKAIKLELGPIQRDFAIYVATLLYLVLIFWDLKIVWFESLVLVLFMPLYLTFIGKDQAQFEETSNTKSKGIPRAIMAGYGTQRYNIFYEQKKKYFSYHMDEDSSDEEEGGKDEEGEELVERNQTGMKPNYYDQDKVFYSRWVTVGERLLDWLYRPWKVLFDKTLPIKSSPILAFLICMIYCFLITRYTIFTVDTIISWFEVSPTFVGLTMMAWGGNIGGKYFIPIFNMQDVISSVAAAKLQQVEIMTSSIIGSQIFNLQICLGAPWLIANMLFGPIYIDDPTVFSSIIVALLVVIASFSLMRFFDYSLGFGLGSTLVACYAAYVVFEFKKNLSSPDAHLNLVSQQLSLQQLTYIFPIHLYFS